MELLENTDPLLREIAEKVYAGTRISVEEGVMLYEKAETAFLGILANFVREKKNGQNTYFNKNFHIEPTNVCLYTCNFCAYSQQYKSRKEWNI